ncbi:HTH_Tnp_Tc3_2 domain-containing protein [Trichonephila clavipes]|uniref:HTH_Tnp_Tc3_2 domain-containing protein n=1 Tax=Trichonephila clavipes TaxID=2585209 RepID=A0A8X6VT46_TRICX|nr:HTH_Tnp_Tc3_2 domain-containing protein [Trichonephila clavipes]
MVYGVNLSYWTYRPVLAQELMAGDQEHRFDFCNPDNLNEVFWSDECQFSRQGTIMVELLDDWNVESTQREVSEELGIAHNVISRLWQRFQDDGNVSMCYSTGRPRVTTPNEDRYLTVTSKRNRRSEASDLSLQLSSATGMTVSRQTMYRRLGHIGLYARRPVRCVPLTATHSRVRLTWSREHALWTPQQWSCVMFSDESRFSLQSDSHRNARYPLPPKEHH